MNYALQAALEWFKQQDLSSKSTTQAAKMYKNAVKSFQNQFEWKKHGKDGAWKMNTFHKQL